MAVYLLDADEFKNLNDQRGHLAGDLVVQRIANVLVEKVRASDGFGLLAMLNDR